MFKLYNLLNTFKLKQFNIKHFFLYITLLFICQIFLLLFYFSNIIPVTFLRLFSTLFVFLMITINIILIIKKKLKMIYFLFFIWDLLIYIYFLQPLFLDNLFRIFIWVHTILFLISYFYSLKERFLSYKFPVKTLNILKETFFYLKTTINNTRTYFGKNHLLNLFILFWFFYSIFSLIWAKSTTRVFIRLEFIFYALLISFFIHFYHNKFNLLNTIEIIIVLVFIISIFTGLFEIYSGKHLPSARAFRYVKYNKYIPGSVYWNENDFATFIVMFFPFLLFSIFKIKIKTINYKRKCINLFILLLLIIFILYSFKELFKTSSRANILALYLFFIFFVIGIIFYLFINLKNKKNKIIFLTLLFIILLTSIIISLKKNQNSIVTKIINKTFVEIKPNLKKKNSSIYVRINLIKNGFIMLKDSHFIGVGAGNAEILMPVYAKKYYKTYGITNLHNFWIELLVDYGVIVFLFFLFFYLHSLYFLLKYFLKLLKIKKLIPEKEYINKKYYQKNVINYNLIKIVIIFSSLLSFPLSSSSTSSLVTRPLVWIYFSYISSYIKNLNITTYSKQ